MHIPQVCLKKRHVSLLIDSERAKSKYADSAKKSLREACMEYYRELELLLSYKVRRYCFNIRKAFSRLTIPVS